MVNPLLRRLMFRVSKTVARHFAQGYEDALDTKGLDWTLELLDEDVETYGNPYVHHLAKAGVVLLAQERCFLGDERCSGCRVEPRRRHDA